MIRLEVLQKLDESTLKMILSAQLDELTERRQVRDPDLFGECFAEVAPTKEGTADGQTDTLACVVNFSDAAGEAFSLYHQRRAQNNAAADEDPAGQPDGGTSAAPDTEEESEA